MKKSLVLLFNLGANFIELTQTEATIELKDSVDGICNQKEVYVLFPTLGDNQVKAIMPLTEVDVEKKINSEVEFLQKNRNPLPLSVV